MAGIEASAGPKRATRLDGLSASLEAWRGRPAPRGFAGLSLEAWVSLAAMGGSDPFSKVADLLWANPLSVNVFFDFEPLLAY